MITKYIRRVPGFDELDHYLRRRYSDSGQAAFAPAGSYYSPLPDYDEVKTRAATLFAKDVDVPSINLRSDQQKVLFEELSQFYSDFDWPEQSTPQLRYYLANAFFKVGDAIILYAILRRFRPQRIIEVGSGFSSALMLDTNDRFLENSIAFTFIDPNPERLHSVLTSKDFGYAKLIEQPVQQVTPNVFLELEANDLLFIDSSHVTKIGSDVNYLLFEILPQLRPGVLVHIHDIMWPFEYPEEWIIEGRSWNEAYIVRAFLQYNERYRILLFNSYFGYKYRHLIAKQMPKCLENPGGSLWLRAH